MAGINKVILIGNVGTDPEIRHLEGGSSVAQFRLATTEYYKDRNGNRAEQTEWHTIIAWRGLAEIVEKIIHKGAQVFVEGKIRTRQWEDKDKNKRQTTEIVADVITLLQSRRDEGNPQSHSGNPPQQTQDPTGDLPF